MQTTRRKKIILASIAIIAIVLVMALLLRAGGISPGAGAGESGSVVFDIKIVDTNDIHTYIEDNADTGNIGLDRVAGIIQYARENSDLTLALDGGDTYHGRPLGSLSQGASIARVIGLVGYDAMTAGNHDWNYGKDRCRELGELSGLPILTGNVVDENGNGFFPTDRLIKEVTKDNVTLRIGVFGVIDPTLFAQAMPSLIEGLTAQDNVAYARQMASELRADGCDIVIAMTHSLYPATVAEQVDGVDLWICGHEHTYIDEAVTTPDGGVAYLSECGYRLQSVGLIDLQYEVSDDGAMAITGYDKTTIEYDASQEFDKVPEVTAALDDVLAENAAVMAQEIGSTTVSLNGEWEAVRVGQTDLGNVITDAYLDLTGADIAFEHAGQIRSSVEPGTITYGDVVAISPFGTYIVTKSISGKDILDCLETSIAIQVRNREAQARHDDQAWPARNGACLQVGGMAVIYDPTREEGSRIISVEIGGEPLEESREYTLATNSYVADLDVYPAIAEAPETGQFPACDEALIRYIEKGPETIAQSASDVRYVERTE